MNLIDKDELYARKFKSTSKRMDLFVAYKSGWNDAVDAIIENAPTIETEPIRHGKWLFNGYQTKCSVCDDVIELEVGQKWNSPYCPNCGAKMEEVNND